MRKNKYEISTGARKIAYWQALRHQISTGGETRHIRLALMELEAPELFRKPTPQNLKLIVL